MKDDKLTFKSNAKIKNFSVDDIGKLSINDVKELKNIFQPKRRTPKKEENREAQTMRENKKKNSPPLSQEAYSGSWEL